MKVSIIIPCYNVEQHIDDALCAALGQSYENTEVICVDNGSTDRTREYILPYVSQGIVTLLDEPNQGAPAARNKGWRISTGSWIQFLDADDIILPNKIQRQVDLISPKSDVPFIASDYDKIDLESGRVRHFTTEQDVWTALLSNSLGITSANLFNRAYLEQVSGWDEQLKSSQEYDLMFRVMQVNDCPIIDDIRSEILIQHRSEGSISADEPSALRNRYLEVLARICTYLKKEKPEVFNAINPKWFQQVFIRIYLNAIDGEAGSRAYYKSILPKGFVPEEHELIPDWFRSLMMRLGYARAERARSIKASIYR